MTKREAIMAAGNTPVLTIICLAAFMWLAGESREWQKQNEHGYTQEQIEAVNRLVEPKPKKPVKMTQEEQAAALVYLWGEGL